MTTLIPHLTTEAHSSDGPVMRTGHGTVRHNIPHHWIRLDGRTIALLIIGRRSGGPFH